MDLFDAAILGAVQGVTEFLPISSSGHLVLGEEALGLSVESLKSFDVAVHMGTLLAILIYFWKDFLALLMGFWKILTFKVRRNDVDALSVFYLIVGTVPAVFVGILLGDLIDETFRGIEPVAWSLIVTGVLFFVAEWFNKKVSSSRVTIGRALAIGLFQATALIPGVSRSGSTISGGLIFGLSREKAARFSFILGAPAMLGAGIWTYMNEVRATSNVLVEVGADPISISYFPFDPATFAVGVVVSALVGLLSVWWLMKFLKKYSLRIFAVYLFVIGIITLLGVNVF